MNGFKVWDSNKPLNNYLHALFQTLHIKTDVVSSVHDREYTGGATTLLAFVSSFLL